MTYANVFVCIQVIGPMANDSSTIFGTYTAHPDARFVSTPADGLSRLSNETRHAAGCDNPACQNYDPDAVKNAVKGAELVVVCLGLGTHLSCFRVISRDVNEARTRTRPVA